MNEELKEMMNDPFYHEIVGKCTICNRDTPRGESHVCNKCVKVYCMNCVSYTVNDDHLSATIKCPENHFIATASNYEDDIELGELT